jgi:hypothetical protein
MMSGREQKGTVERSLAETPQLTGVAYIFLVAGTVLSLAALPNWKIELGLSILGVLFIGRALGQSVFSSVGGVFAAVTVVLLKTNPSEIPLGYRLVGLLAALVCLSPLLLRKRHDTGFPLLGTFCVIQGLYIYIGALIAAPSLPYQATYTVRIRELGLVGSLAYVSVIVAIGLMARRIRPVVPSIRRWTSRTTEMSSKTFSRSVLLFIVGLSALHLNSYGISSQLGALPSIISLARIVAIVLMLLLWLRGSLTPTKKAVVILAIFVDVVSGASSEFALYTSAGVAIGAMILLLVLRPRLVAWLLLLIIPILLVFNVAKAEARAEARASPTKPSGFLDPFHILVSDSLNTVTHPTPGALTTSAERFANADLLGYIEFHVPRDYPYWNKQSYTELPYLLVPRIIAPFKPKLALANEFGRTYGLLDPNDFGTSENTPLQVEAWVNFGPEGLVAIAIIIGGLLGFGERLLDRRTLDGLVIGVLVVFQLSSGIESGVIAWALAIPSVIIFVPITRWAIGRAGDRQRVPSVGG